MKSTFSTFIFVCFSILINYFMFFDCQYYNVRDSLRPTVNTGPNRIPYNNICIILSIVKFIDNFQN